MSGTDPYVGRVLGGRYLVEARLARGGMGRVYRAVQEPLGRAVAVKVVLLPEDGADAADVRLNERFAREAASAARVSHPHIVTLVDSGVDAATGHAYLVMESLAGETLQALLRRHGPLPPARAIQITEQAAWALTALHRAGIVHRDLKPSNIFLQALEGPARIGLERDFVKVIDFGLALDAEGTEGPMTRTGRFLGSPGYMAPEQIRAETVDGRADVYALGAVLFEMVTGAMPLARSTPLATMSAHVYEPLPPPVGPNGALPPQLQALVRRAMSKDAAHRPTMVDFLAELVALQRTFAPAGAPPEAWQDGPKGEATLLLPSQACQAPPQALGAACAAPSDGIQSRILRPSGGGFWRRSGPTGAWAEASAAWVRRRGVGTKAALALTLSVAALTAPLWHRATRASAQVRGYTLLLDSDPQGASVWWGTRNLCRETPCEARVEVRPDRRHLSLRFVHQDFEEFVLTRPLGGKRLAVRAQLRP